MAPPARAAAAAPASAAGANAFSRFKCGDSSPTRGLSIGALTTATSGVGVAALPVALLPEALPPVALLPVVLVLASPTGRGRVDDVASTGSLRGAGFGVYL